ncbi:hypothetical protein Ddc_17496 [Ditylenchus destructor]|nr:hypothetical protein Ddc_17496 [Ditylenchus destructor]
MGIAISTLLGARATKESANLQRTKVKLSNDCWLDVLKFLSCTQWSEKRYVSRQINGIAERNISRLPRAIIEKAILGMNSSTLIDRQIDAILMRTISRLALEIIDRATMHLSDVHDAIFAFDDIIPERQIERWFLNRGITLESRVQYQPRSTPWGIMVEKALFGNYTDCTDMCILGPAQEKVQVQKSWLEYLFLKEEALESLVFHAEFHPAKKFSWASLEQFLTFLFTPLSYVKVVEMYAVNQKFVDAVKEKFVDNFFIHGNAMHTLTSNDNKPPYIHCEKFSLLYTFIHGMNVDGLCNTLTWLERNVRAESIRMPFVSMYTHSQDKDAVCRLLTDFVFGALRICAKRELRLHSENKINLNYLFFSLIEKFRTLPQIEREIPTIVIESLSLLHLGKIQSSLGPNVIYREVDSQGAEFQYVFENGHNRLRISFCESRLPHETAKEYDCYVQSFQRALKRFSSLGRGKDALQRALEKKKGKPTRVATLIVTEA